MGYVHDSGKIWRLWDSGSGRVFEASDVVFDELRVMGTRDEHRGVVHILRPCVSEDLPPEEDTELLSELEYCRARRHYQLWKRLLVSMKMLHLLPHAVG